MVASDLIIFLIPAIGSICLGYIVYLKNKKNLSNRFFALISFTIFLWAVANYFSLNPAFVSQLVWIRLVIFFAVLLQFAFFLFVHIFPQNKVTMPKPVMGVLVILALLTMAATLSPYIFSELEQKKGEAVPLPGALMPLFVFSIFLFLGLGAYYIIKKYISFKAVERVQWRYVSLGFFIMFFLLISSQLLAVVVFRETGFVKLGPLFTLPFIVLSAYAVIKHHLMAVRVVATEIFAATMVLLFLIDTMVSKTPGEFMFRGALLILSAIFGAFLIRGTLQEIKELERLSNAKSEFISIVSHQLRTPLTAVKGYVSMILEGSYGKGLTEKIKEPLRNIYQSNERLINLINDILNLSRIETGKMQLAKEETSIEEIIENVVEELKISAGNKELDLIHERPAALLPKLSVDKEKIRQVILNLVDNAIKYTQQGTVSISSKIVPKDAGRRKTLLIEVKDTGEGMDKDEPKRLFHSFYRGKAGQALWHEGAGLGLHIAKKFVEMHEGKIWAESDGKGKGSSFFVELPI